MEEQLRAIARTTPWLKFLALFGSRARGDHRPESDWDFAYAPTSTSDPDALLAELVGVLGSDRVQLVDVDRVNGLLRTRIARDGKLLYEARPGAFTRFTLEATSFWCDAEPTLQRAYDSLLAKVGG